MLLDGVVCPPSPSHGGADAPPLSAVWSSEGWYCRWSRPNAGVRGAACPPQPPALTPPTPSSTSASVGTSCSNWEHWEGMM